MPNTRREFLSGAMRLAGLTATLPLPAWAFAGSRPTANDIWDLTIGETPIVIGDRKLGRRVSRLVKDIGDGVEAQRRCLLDLENLGWDAMPAIIGPSGVISRVMTRTSPVRACPGGFPKRRLNASRKPDSDSNP